MKPRSLTGLLPAILTGLVFHTSHSAEVQLNLTTAQDQERQHVAQLAGGTLVSVYEDESVTNGQILLRRFNSALSPVGGEQRANALENGERREPVVAALTGGGFVVAYTAGNLDMDGYAVAFRRFDANATPLDPTDVQANSVVAGAQFRPQIAPLTNGGFVLAWLGQSGGTGQDIFFRRFDADGQPIDPGEIAANALGNDPVAAGDQGNHKIATLSDGGFVIVYEDRASGDVFGVRFSATGAAIDVPADHPGNKQFQVNITGAHEQTAPAVAALANGGFVITFNSETNDTASSRRIMGRIYNAMGIGTNEFPTGAHAGRWQDSAVIGLTNGDFVVTWQAVGEGADAGTENWSVFEQRFSPDGTPRFPPLLVNNYNAGDQDRPSLARFNGAGYVIAWQSFGQDGSGGGVFAQTLETGGTAPGVLTIARLPVQVAVDFAGQANRPHQLQKSFNLASWSAVLTTNTANGQFRYFEATTNAPPGYFRVQSF